MMNTDLLCVPLLCNLFFNIIYAPACECILCCHILPIPCLCMACRFCAWRAGSVHGVQVLCMVWTFCTWCGRSVHGVDVLCMVCAFSAWCGRSVHGVHVLCMDAVSPLALVRHVSNHSTYTCTCTCYLQSWHASQMNNRMQVQYLLMIS